jgi:molybdate transport system ATP-binding protein
LAEVAVTIGDGLRARIVVSRPDGFALDLALDIPSGSTAVLLGPNGAGKTTAAAALSGLVPLDAGRIELRGVALDDPAWDVFVTPRDRRVGVVFQDYLLFPHMTVAENIAFGLASRGLSQKGALGEASRWIDRLGLGELAERRPRDLSGGQAQRVALGRALVTNPEFLILDEPLSALDIETRSGLRRLLAEHLEQFVGPRLLITHDPTEAFLLGDQIHIIEEGTLTQAGTADDIRLRPRTEYAAGVAGSNLLVGSASDGVVRVGDHQIRIADTSVTGPVLATIHPRAVSLHAGQPEGSPRNSWKTSVLLIEDLGERVRLEVGSPLPLAVEVTPGAVDAMGIGAGSEIWVSVKATEIGVQPG